MDKWTDGRMGGWVDGWRKIDGYRYRDWKARCQIVDLFQAEGCHCDVPKLDCRSAQLEIDGDWNKIFPEGRG